MLQREREKESERERDRERDSERKCYECKRIASPGMPNSACPDFSVSLSLSATHNIRKLCVAEREREIEKESECYEY